MQLAMKGPDGGEILAIRKLGVLLRRDEMKTGILNLRRGQLAVGAIGDPGSISCAGSGVDLRGRLNASGNSGEEGVKLIHGKTG